MELVKGAIRKGEPWWEIEEIKALIAEQQASTGDEPGEA